MWQPTLLLLVALQSATASEFQLPTSVTPSHYDLRLLYSLDPATNFQFYGIVDIVLSVSEAITSIVLHASSEFSISNDENGIVLSGPPSSPKVTRALFDVKHGFLTLELDKEMEQNIDYTLRIKFYGNANRGMNGAYISSYVDSKSGTEEYLILTQFEPDAARKAFPCFDEPAYKATFNITIGHQKGFTAISNMPLQSGHDANDLLSHWPLEIIQEKFGKQEITWSEFQKSVVMSTYLVAFVVSKLAHVDSPPGHSTTQFRVWARRDVIHQTTYAADIGPRLLTYFEKYFGIRYSLPKVDMVAIPGDSIGGGMENWGLIAYSEVWLLNDDQQPLVSRKMGTALVVAHEIAHSWFGNLVTMKWWSELWLKEGFVNLLANFVVDEIEPSWNTKISNLLPKAMRVKKLDALESSHAVTVPIEDPSHILEIYDDITYGKGQIVLRMMNMFLGDAFKRGIHNYLEKYSYKSTEADDLWREMTAASRALGQSLNVSVKQVMDSWITQTGYPLLTVTRDYSRNQPKLSVSQKRFLSRSEKESPERVSGRVPRHDERPSWWVPLRVLCEPHVNSPREAIMWLADESTTSPHHFADCSHHDQWVIFNYDMIALYRVNYDERNWKLLSDTLNSDQYTKVPMLGRVQLVSDVLALAWTNHLDYSLALELVAYLHREKEQLAFDAGLDHLLEIGNILKRSLHHDVFVKYMAWLIRDTYSVADIFQENPEAGYRKKGDSAISFLGNWYDSLHRPEGMARFPGPCWQSMGLNMWPHLGRNQRLLASPSIPEVLRTRLLTIEDNEVKDWICDALPDCQEKAKQLFRQWMETKDPDRENPIREALYSKVYQIAIMRGEKKHWRFLFDRLQNTNNDELHRSKIMEALTQTPESSLRDEFLRTLFVEGSQFSAMESWSALMSMLKSKYGYQTAKDFLYKRFDDINKRMASASVSIIGVLYSSLVNQFTTQQEIDEFLKWREKHELSEGSLVLRQALDTAAANAEWVARHQRTVVDKLRELTGDMRATSERSPQNTTGGALTGDMRATTERSPRNTTGGALTGDMRATTERSPRNTTGGALTGKEEKKRLRTHSGGVDGRASPALITCTAVIRLYSFYL